VDVRVDQPGHREPALAVEDGLAGARGGGGVRDQAVRDAQVAGHPAAGGQVGDPQVFQ